MAHRITAVSPGGLASRCGLRPGDVLLSINGEAVLDQVDYQYLTAQARLVLTVRSPRGTVEIELEKDEGEPLGLTFDSTLMARPRTCANRCVFCFIDQMPPGLRDTLYVKDDDWRLSLMMGNYITLTNLSEAECNRIIARRASPLYISVHATDGAVRVRMMQNPRAADLMAQLRRLRDAGIAFHAQVVLCPGINDGPVLDDTLCTLSSLWPAARSVALVPVGLTRHREGLSPLVPYDADGAAALLKQVSSWQETFLETLDTRFAFAADEFYCLSGVALPPEEAYEGYPQIENGVGLLRSFEREFDLAYRFLDGEAALPRRVVIATGTSAAPFLQAMIAAHPVPGVDVAVLPVENRFFGPSVTVAGLLTGQDLRRALSRVKADEVLISRAMLRQEDGLFLDGDTPDGLAAALSIPVHAVDCDGAAFLDALLGDCFGTEENV